MGILPKMGEEGDESSKDCSGVSQTEFVCLVMNVASVQSTAVARYLQVRKGSSL